MGPITWAWSQRLHRDVGRAFSPMPLSVADPWSARPPRTLLLEESRHWAAATADEGVGSGPGGRPTILVRRSQIERKSKEENTRRNGHVYGATYSAVFSLTVGLAQL